MATKMTAKDLPSVNGAGLFMTTRDVSYYLGISHPTVCRLCSSGKIPAMKVGKQWRIPVRWMAEQLGLNDDE